MQGCIRLQRITQVGLLFPLRLNDRLDPGQMNRKPAAQRPHLGQVNDAQLLTPNSPLPRLHSHLPLNGTRNLRSGQVLAQQQQHASGVLQTVWGASGPEAATTGRIRREDPVVQVRTFGRGRARTSTILSRQIPPRRLTSSIHNMYIPDMEGSSAVEMMCHNWVQPLYVIESHHSR